MEKIKSVLGLLLLLVAGVFVTAWAGTHQVHAADVIPLEGISKDKIPPTDALQSGRGSLRSEVVAAIPIALSRQAVADARKEEAPTQMQMSRAAEASSGSAVSDFFSPQRELLRSITRNLLRFSTIRVKGNYRLHDDQILRAAGLNDSPWLWEFSAEEIRTRLLHSPWIESASTEVSPFPARLELSVTEAEPWMIAEYERHSWLVSRKGILLQTLDTLQDPELIFETTELPRLDGLEPQAMVESYLSSANARFNYATKLIRLLQSAGELPFPVERFTLLQNGCIKLVPQEQSAQTAEVLLSVRSFEEASTGIDRLNRVLADLKRRDERVRRIDLRFKNQAIID